MRKQTKLVAVLSAAALFAIGASMTSFAAGWAQEDGSWVYLDRDGDRVTEEWKKSGSNYYWLDEDGYMATNLLVEDDDDHYYVNENGVRVTNQWVSIDNVDGDTVDDKEVDTLWYYMGSSGRAYKASENSETGFRNTLIDGKRYLFDSEGRMVSGWTYVGNDTYYLGDENEGWAYTGWQILEIDEDEMGTANSAGAEYEDEAWFYFQSSGKAYKNARKYIEGYYYSFDENGVMEDAWLIGTPSSYTDKTQSYYKEESGYQKTGWVYTHEPDDEDSDNSWYYLVSSKKGAAFNLGGMDAKGATNSNAQKYINGDTPDGTLKDQVAAKVINGKTYLFDKNGKMQTGVFKVAEDDQIVRDGGNGNLGAGIYYFNKDGGSVNGQMETGKVTLEYDGEDYVYYFAGTGKAYTNEMKDNSIYDGNGVRVEAGDGNNYEVVNVKDIAGGYVVINNKRYENGAFVVSASGKVKKSGTVTIDGVKYVIGGKQSGLDDGEEVDDYFVSWAYDKDADSDERVDLGNYDKWAEGVSVNN